VPDYKGKEADQLVAKIDSGVEEALRLASAIRNVCPETALGQIGPVKSRSRQLDGQRPKPVTCARRVAGRAGCENPYGPGIHPGVLLITRGTVDTVVNSVVRSA
jgi:hypothetical protein